MNDELMHFDADFITNYLLFEPMSNAQTVLDSVFTEADFQIFETALGHVVLDADRNIVVSIGFDGTIVFADQPTIDPFEDAKSVL